ncbi:MAG: DUF4365 domain-containing protein [Actinobacteria bacterium]|nr:DUF4365 domain-containing protein [Actinomycetota bacterium]
MKKANEQLITKGPSSTDQVEKESKQIFQSKVPIRDAQIIWYGDKYPNLDGHIEFLEEKSSTTVKLFFQLKGSKQDIAYYDCDRFFLNYCYRAAEPTFLIFVNIPQQKVYWEHISPTYIKLNLGIRDLATFDQQTKRINFLKEKIIDKNTKILEGICTKHYQDSAEVREYVQEAKTKGERISGQELINNKIKEAISLNKQEAVNTLQQVNPQEKEIYADVFDCLKKKFAVLINNMTDKLMLYYSFVYMLKPFYLDQRGEKKRRKLIDLIQISASQERFIIESLINSNFLGRVGDLIFVAKKEEAISILNNYIDAGKLNLKEITGLFSQDEN